MTEQLMAMVMRSAPMAAGALGIGAVLYGGAKYGDAALPYYNVIGGQAAVEYNRFSGVQPQTYTEGMHYKTPWITRPTIFNIKYEPYNLRTYSGSRDLQMVDMNLRVLTRPIVDQLPAILQDLGQDYREKVLPSIVNEVLKSEVARHDANQLLAHREQISAKIKEDLVRCAQKFGIQVQDVSITHLTFSDQYSLAVEAKQVAQQEAERSRYIVEKAKQECEAIKIKAMGEAEAAQKIGDAMKENPGFLQLRRIEAARDIAQVVSKSANTVFLDASTLLLNLGSHSSDVSGARSSRQDPKLI